MELLYKILLGLDAIVYNFINWLFQIFLILTRVNIFSEETITPFIKRVYTIVGTIMLFVLAYSMLRGIVNPETKGKDTAGKTIFAVVKAVVLLALVPTLFDFAYEIQDSILRQNTIGKLILGNNATWKDVQKINGIDDSKLSQSLTETIDKGGITMASTILDAFIISKTGEDVNIDGNSSITLSGIKDTIQTNEEFDIITELAPEIAKDDSQIKYIWIVSTCCGAYIAILLLGYCLALGLRVVKLAFYELIAPLPIRMSILPNHKDSLSKWFGEVSKTFLDVFIRIGVLYIVVYLISLVRTSIDSGVEVFGGGVSGFNKFMAGAIIVMGIVTFAKKAPELLTAATGIKTEGIGMGWNAIKEQLKTGGFYTAAGIAGGALLGAGRRIGERIDKVRKNDKYIQKEKNETKDQKKNRLKNNRKLYRNNAGGFFYDMLGGTIGGGYQGGKNSKEAGSLKDAWNSAQDASNEYARNRAEKLYKKENRKEKYLANNKKVEWNKADGIWGNLKNAGKTTWDNAKNVGGIVIDTSKENFKDKYLHLGETEVNIEKAKKEQEIKDQLKKNPDIIKLSAEDYIKKHMASLYASPELTKEFQNLTKALKTATESGNTLAINTAQANLNDFKNKHRSLLEVESAIETAKRSGDAKAIADATQTFKDMEKSIKDNYIAHVMFDPEAVQQQSDIKFSIENLKASIKANASSMTGRMMIDGVEGISEGLLESASKTAGKSITDLTEALEILSKYTPDKLVKITNKITEYSESVNKAAINRAQEEKKQKEIDKK